MAIPSNKPQNRILLVGGIVFALLAGVVVYLAVNKSAATANTPPANVPVVVAAQQIQAGMTITATDVSVQKLAAPSFGTAYYTKVSEVEGQLAGVTITKGSIITQQMLGSSGSGGLSPGSGLQPFTIAQGYEALAIPAAGSAAGTTVDQMTVGYNITTGSQIDIIADLGGATTTDHAVVYAFQDVPVLAVNYPTSSASPSAGAASTTQAAPEDYVVEMTPQQAEEMTALLSQDFAQSSQPAGATAPVAGNPPLVLKYLLRPVSEYGTLTPNTSVTPATITFAPKTISLPTGALTPTALCQDLGGGAQCGS